MAVSNASTCNAVIQEMLVRPPNWEDPLKEEMATHLSILAWRISWTEEPGGLQSMGSQSQDMTEKLTHTHTHTHTHTADQQRYGSFR